MTTAILVVVAVIIGAVVLAGIYALAIAYAFEEEPYADEIHYITTDDGWHIRLCRYTSTKDEGEPVLIVHGLCANQFNMALPDGHSLIDHLSRNGFDCWAIEMRGTRSSRGPSGVSRHKARLEDVPGYDIPAAIRFIQAATGAGRVHWVGHSLGGLVYYAYEQMHGPEALASVCTLGTPPGMASVPVPSGPILNLARRFHQLFPSLAEFDVRAWAPWVPLLKVESVHVPINWANMHPKIDAAACYNLIELAPVDFFDTLRHWAEEGAWIVKNGAVDVQAGLTELQTPLLSIYGAADPLAQAAAGQAFVEALSIKDKALLTLSEADGCVADYNHVDLAFGVNAEQEIFEPIRQWMAAHAASGSLREFAADAASVPGPGQDTSWRKALRRAAEVMDDFGGNGGARVKTKKTAKSAAAKRAKPRKTNKAGPAKKSSTAKPNTKKAPAKKKKAATKSKAKTKPKAKQKTAAKKKTTKKKSTTTKKSATTRKKTAKPKKKTTAKKKKAAKKKGGRR